MKHFEWKNECAKASLSSWNSSILKKNFFSPFLLVFPVPFCNLGNISFFAFSNPSASTTFSSLEGELVTVKYDKVGKEKAEKQVLLFGIDFEGDVVVHVCTRYFKYLILPQPEHI